MLNLIINPEQIPIIDLQSVISPEACSIFTSHRPMLMEENEYEVL
jgi:hypothetical protein